MHLKTRKKDGEKIRRKLVEEDALDRDMRIQKDNSFIYFPLKKKIEIKDTIIVEMRGEKTRKHKKTLEEYLRNKLSVKEREQMPKSYDIIGDIAVIEITKELVDKKGMIGEALLETFSNIKVVARKKTEIKTKYRTRKIELIAGEKRTETVHREHGCLFKVDIQQTYFSPRLSAERSRVKGKVKKGERVLVMFAGVGPYPVLIAKYSKPKEVVAIELNPKAVEYMRENIRVNKVQVKVVEGDVREEIKKLGLFDRIIMPLPKDAGDFLDVALPALQNKGEGHFYDFAREEKEAVEKVEKLTEKLGYRIKILDAVKCGSYSPGVYRICVDFTLQ